jgi:hypothetical protein
MSAPDAPAPGPLQDLVEAALALRRAGRPVRFDLDADGWAVRVHVGPTPPAAQEAGLSSRVLSPLGLSVVRILLAHGRPLKGAAIGARSGEVSGRQASGKLKTLLADMVERRVLLHGPRGYEIDPEFRPHAQALTQ